MNLKTLLDSPDLPWGDSPSLAYLFSEASCERFAEQPRDHATVIDFVQNQRQGAHPRGSATTDEVAFLTQPLIENRTGKQCIAIALLHG